MPLPYLASQGCASLNQFFQPKQKVARLVRETSTESYHNHCDKDSQVMLVEGLLRDAPEGLTDYELREQLILHGVTLPLSSVSARRNDVNKKHRDKGLHVVVNVDKESRVNPRSGKRNLVWRYRFH